MLTTVRTYGSALKRGCYVRLTWLHVQEGDSVESLRKLSQLKETKTTAQIQTLENGWLSYASQVIPADAPPIQLQECRRAFYAGAHVVMQSLIRVGESDISDEQGCELLSALEGEINAFYQRIIQGKS